MLDSQRSSASPGPVDAHIGGRAAARRQALGLALGDVAQTLGVDGTVLYALEHGQQRFAPRQLWKLSRRLQVPMAWFFNPPGDGPQAQTTQSKAPQTKTSRSKTKTAEPIGVQLVFVPNPDLDPSDDAEPIAIH